MTPDLAQFQSRSPPIAVKPWLGLNSNDQASSNFAGPQGLFQQYGISWTRHSQVHGQANDGEGGLLLADLTNAANAGFTSVVELLSVNYGQSLPYITGAAITAYANWFVSQVKAIEAALPGAGTLYEIDNEPWNFYTPAATAAQYADVVVAVLTACQAAGLDLTRIFAMAKDTNWVPAMYAQQPTLKTLAQGWTFHPYGPPPPGYGGGGSQGIAAVPVMRATLASGATNILISEIGFQDQTISNTPGGGNLNAATSTQAGQWMADMLEQAAAYHAAGWLRALLVYHRTAGNYAAVQVNTNGTLTATGAALVNFAARMRPNNNQGYAPRTPGIYLPYDDGAFGVTLYPEAAHDAVPLTAGKLHLFRLRIDVYDFINHLTVWVDTADAGLTAGQNFVGIFQQQLAAGAGAYVLQGSIADQSANWNAAGRKMVNLISGFSAVPGYYWAAVLPNGNTTLRLRGILNGAQLNFGNFGGLPQRIMQSVASFTALPASLDLSSGAVVSASAFASSVFVAAN